MSQQRLSAELGQIMLDESSPFTREQWDGLQRIVGRTYLTTTPAQHYADQAKAFARGQYVRQYLSAGDVNAHTRSTLQLRAVP